jgi:hypothetical protein
MGLGSQRTIARPPSITVLFSVPQPVGARSVVSASARLLTVLPAPKSPLPANGSHTDQSHEYLLPNVTDNASTMRGRRLSCPTHYTPLGRTVPRSRPLMSRTATHTWCSRNRLPQRTPTGSSCGHGWKHATRCYTSGASVPQLDAYGVAPSSCPSGRLWMRQYSSAFASSIAAGL